MTTSQAMAPASDHPRSTTGSDFAVLSRRITEAGLLDRRPGYYALRISVVAGLFVAGWAVFVLLGASWWQLAVAAVMGVVFGQIGLLTHDLAHRQVFRLRRPARLAGWLAGNLCVGLSYGWWMDKHTRHHANPNHEELDPDVAPDILVWSTRQAKVSSGVPRAIGRWQAWLFFPLLTLEGLNLRVGGIRGLRRPGLSHRRVEAALLAVHIIGYLTVLFVLLPPGMAFAFFGVHQAVLGVYVGSTFAPNHKGMPTQTGPQRLDFLRRQVLTTRNVRGGTVTDIAMGGLNYQIEHHLFPNMPSPNLRRAQPIVREYCAELGLPYEETSLLMAYRLAMRHLNEVGRHTSPSYESAR